MQNVDAAYWKRAREVLAAERTRGESSEPWSALRRLSNEIFEHLDPLHARALVELGLGLARPHLPSLESARVNEDGSLSGVDSADDRDEEAVLACVLGLLANVDGADQLQERLATMWPGH